MKKKETEGAGKKHDGRTAVNKASVLLVCSQTLIREGLRLLLITDDDLGEIWTSPQISDALARLADLQPDVVIAVYGWPDAMCTADLRRLKADRQALPVLLISADTRPEQVQGALLAGATGYLPLTADPDELVRAIVTAGRGELSLHRDILPSLFIYLADRTPAVVNPELDVLSLRQQEVLACLTRGLSDRDIAQELFISVRTVQTHLAHIYAKLDVHSRTEAAVLAVDAGWFSS